MLIIIIYLCILAPKLALTLKGICVENKVMNIKLKTIRNKNKHKEHNDM